MSTTYLKLKSSVSFKQCQIMLLTQNELRNHSYLEQGNVSKIHKILIHAKLASMDYPINGSPSEWYFTAHLLREELCNSY